ncbi:hypothetical protein M408DRAFT_325854 [Serendipita vermifera MAFF 305830]|uniref:Uncharacterized protein n=1 Tax=Serendipita vermifera MAFF 305830 TaxID=933852 RepID=A0A0C2Y024_SERVB|nr:hypothetical protein M408DRAFT_325854 [Serendipita vermifera MAFF 305830]
MRLTGVSTALDALATRLSTDAPCKLDALLYERDLRSALMEADAHEQLSRTLYQSFVLVFIRIDYSYDIAPKETVIFMITLIDYLVPRVRHSRWQLLTAEYIIRRLIMCLFKPQYKMDIPAYDKDIVHTVCKFLKDSIASERCHNLDLEYRLALVELLEVMAVKGNSALELIRDNNILGTDGLGWLIASSHHARFLRRVFCLLSQLLPEDEGEFANYFTKIFYSDIMERTFPPELNHEVSHIMKNRTNRTPMGVVNAVSLAYAQNEEMPQHFYVELFMDTQDGEERFNEASVYLDVHEITIWVPEDPSPVYVIAYVKLKEIRSYSSDLMKIEYTAYDTTPKCVKSTLPRGVDGPESFMKMLQKYGQGMKVAPLSRGRLGT